MTTQRPGVRSAFSTGDRSLERVCDSVVLPRVPTRPSAPPERLPGSPGVGLNQQEEETHVPKPNRSAGGNPARVRPC